MRKILIICNIFFALSVIIPINQMSSIILSSSYKNTGEFEWFWHVFIYGDFHAVLLETSKISLVIVLASFLLMKKDLGKKHIFILLILTVISLITYCSSLKIDIIIPVHIYLDYKANDLYVFKVVLYSLYVLCMIGILTSCIYGLSSNRSQVFKFIHFGFSLILVGLYVIKPFYQFSMLEVITTPINYMTFYTIPLFLSGILLFNLFSLFGLKNRVYNSVSIGFFVFIFIAVSYGFVFIFNDRFYLFVFLTKEVMFYLLPLFFVIAIMLVMLMPTKHKRTEKLAQPELIVENAVSLSGNIKPNPIQG